MIFKRGKNPLQALDEMLDEAIAGTFEAQSYNESMLSKVEHKMARFLEQSRLKQGHMNSERERVKSLISDISHQTKTPLSNITLYSQLLSEQDLTGEALKLAGQISVSAETLSFLIKSLVKASRLESGIISIEPKPGDVRELVDAACNQCESLAAEKNIAVSCERGVPPLKAMFDPRWHSEALFNIIENAVKYTPENGRVTLTVEEYEMFVRVDVADTGRGIRPDDIPKIFSRFWRAAESSGSPGVGIGLYLARKIITACGGYIKVSSEPQKGSVFSVFLSKA